MTNQPKTGEIKGVGGGREERGESKNGAERAEATQSGRDAPASQGGKGGVRADSVKRGDSPKRANPVKRGDSPKRGHSSKRGVVPEELPRSAGIDWVAETSGIEELPSEELRSRDARRDDFREMIGEEVLINATSGDDAGEETHEEVVPEEVGGPFVETTAEVELASGSDEANPPDGEAEPLPRVISDTPDLPPR